MRSRVTVNTPHGSQPRRMLAILVAILPLAACGDLPLSQGDENSIIVTADPELWAEVEASLVPALERTVFTVRDEKTFTVTSGELGGENWVLLRQLKRQLVLGTAADPWMERPLAKVKETVVPRRSRRWRTCGRGVRSPPWSSWKRAAK